jgi:hypothetical protein
MERQMIYICRITRNASGKYGCIPVKKMTGEKTVKGYALLLTAWSCISFHMLQSDVTTQ